MLGVAVYWLCQPRTTHRDCVNIVLIIFNNCLWEIHSVLGDAPPPWKTEGTSPPQLDGNL